MTVNIPLPPMKTMPQYRAEWLAESELASVLLKCTPDDAELLVTTESPMLHPIHLSARQLRDLAEVATSGAELLEEHDDDDE